MSDKQFIFPITTGRSGTVYLSELLRLNLPKSAHVHHERIGFQTLGVESPDASHFTRFNSVGNDGRVQAFWRQKLQRLAKGGVQTYAEVSHFLVKAGLIENIAPLAQTGQVDLIILRRDTPKILWSLVNRFDFYNYGFTWLFNLDPRYPNVIVNPKPFDSEGMPGHALWYIHEMWVRAEYYKLLLAGQPNIRLHEFDLSELITESGAARLLEALGHPVSAPKIPPRANQTKQEFFGKDMRATCDKLVARTRVNHAAIAAKYFDAGRRLELGPKRRMSAPPGAQVH